MAWLLAILTFGRLLPSFTHADPDRDCLRGSFPGQLRKNHRPEVIIIAGIIVGAICFGLLWTLSLVYGGGYTKIAAAAVLSVMPALAAWIVPPREIARTRGNRDTDDHQRE